MEIVAIYPPYIYSVRYENSPENEFDRLFEIWNDVDYVANFMETNKSYFQNDFWRDRMNVEKATLQVLEEAEAMEDFFFELNENTKGDKKPDFDSVFHYLDGKYKYELLWQPMKSYGNYNPSLLRLYAIKLQEPNTYLITGGGIKLADTIQNSPDLKDHVFQNIDKVRQYLRENGILDSEDLIE